MIEGIYKRRQRSFEFLKLLYQKTVGENDRRKIVPLSDLSIELGLFPRKKTEEMDDAEKNELYKLGQETETMVLDLKGKNLIRLHGSANPCYDGMIGITDDGIWEVEDIVLGSPLLNPFESKQRQLLQHQYNLNWLKEQEARYGANLYLHNQIEDEEVAIARLEAELSQLREITTKSPSAKSD